MKHARLHRLGEDVVKAANDVRDARKRAKSVAYKRRNGYATDDGKWRAPSEFDPEIEAEAARQLAKEEEAIARKFDMAPGWKYDESERAWRERKARD